MLAGFFYNRYKNEADHFSIASLSTGRSHCPLGRKESAITEKRLWSCIWALCLWIKFFTLGNMGVSLMPILFITLFIINHSTKLWSCLFSGGCLTQHVYSLTASEIKKLHWFRWVWLCFLFTYLFFFYNSRVKCILENNRTNWSLSYM